MATKKEIRRKILKMRKNLDEETVALASQVICRKLMSMDAYEKSTDLCLYMPINNEVDAMLLAESAVEEGKRIWLPKVISRSENSQAGEMCFNAYEGENRLQTGAYDIRESSSEKFLTPSEQTLIIMPGAVFTPWRDRIGYGGGYYDRFIQEHPECKTVALCYDIQIVDELPTEEHDMKPDYLVSETSIYR